jgi:hypothetical protein
VRRRGETHNQGGAAAGENLSQTGMFVPQLRSLSWVRTCGLGNFRILRKVQRRKAFTANGGGGGTRLTVNVEVVAQTFLFVKGPTGKR